MRRPGPILITATGNKRPRRARNEAARQAASRAKEERRAAAAAETRLPSPPAQARVWGRLGADGMWGPLEFRLPPHETSVMRAGGLNPILACNGTGLDAAPVIGRTDTGAVVRFDPWEAYQARLVTSTGMLVMGLMGSGKSMCAKTLAMRLIATGRRVITLGDPKGEWVPLADWLNLGRAGDAQVVAPGRAGTRLNPLDAGAPDPTLGRAQWAQAVAASRANRVRAVVSILRGGARFTVAEENALTVALEEVLARTGEPTLRQVHEHLDAPSPALVSICGTDAPRELALALRLLTAGPLAGMFDSASTVRLDPAAALTVVDTSTLAFSEARIRAIASECVTGWVTAALRSRDGDFRLVVSEEGWEDFRDPFRVAGMDEILRMSGHWGCSLLMIFHELSDADMFGDAGSAHRNQVKGLASKCETQIIYRCSRRERTVVTDLLGLSDMEGELITSALTQGWGWWRIGAALRLCVRPEVTPNAYQAFNTDKGRRG
ncbi:MAG: hypothetical protein LBK95_18625 [Bifidobacteriaceae bacterium]|jgi:hypothetical protein|nr:hypothetical protein [Bifidobacteriaceae bacterium]